MYQLACEDGCLASTAKPRVDYVSMFSELHASYFCYSRGSAPGTSLSSGRLAPFLVHNWTPPIFIVLWIVLNHLFLEWICLMLYSLLKAFQVFLNASCLQPSYMALFLFSKFHFCFKGTISFQDPYLVRWKLCVMCWLYENARRHWFTVRFSMVTQF